MAVPKERYNDYFTYAQYKNWPDDERWEIIGGEAYGMSPAPGTTHQRIIGNIFTRIYNYLKDRDCEVFVSPFDVLLPEPDESEDETSNIVQPDIVVICDDSKLSEKGCTGAPDVVIEIISPSSASRDQIVKLNLYEKLGVGEYWIVHPVDKICWKYVLDGKQYGKPEVYDYKGTPFFHTLPELSVNLKKVFGMENFKDEAQEKRPGYSENSKENRL